MILDLEVNKFLRDIINLLLGSPGYTIRAKQKDAPRPNGSYADVDFVNVSRLGWEQTEFENNSEDLTENISGMREIMMSVSFHREQATNNATKVQTGLIRNRIQDLFKAANLAYIRSSEVREISEAFQQGWEERAQFDIFLSAVGKDSDIVTSIHNVDIEAEYQIRGLIYNSTIEVQ